MRLTDRSRIETLQSCPRRRYWGYEYHGRGLQRKTLAVPLLTGGLIHEALATILGGGVPESAIQAAQLSYRQTASSHILENEDGEASSDQQMLVDVQCALVEALIWAWVKTRLDSFRNEYDVVDIEREELLPISSDIMFMSRPDALLRRKADGSLVILNFKTCSEADMRWVQQWRYDMQTISEVLPVETRMGEKVAGVLIEGLVKGRRNVEYPKGGSNRYNSSPLIWAYRKSDPPFDEWQPKWDYIGEDGKKHTLGRGFQREPVFREYPGGVKAWIAHLMETPEGREVVASTVVPLPLILRSEYEIAEWLAQTTIGEARIAVLPKDVAAFPKHTAYGNCIRPSKCPFLGLCWGVGADDPLATGDYELRQPHHEAEIKKFADKSAEREEQNA